MRERKRFLQIGHVLLEHGELFAFGVVANHDRRAVGGFHAEQPVEIGFIRREDHVEFRILEVHPGEIALVVVVGEQGIGAQAQEVCEGGIVAEIGGFAEVRRHRIQKIAESRMIRIEARAPIFLICSDGADLLDRVGGIDGGLFKPAAAYALFQACPGLLREKEPAARRRRLGADKGFVVVDLIEAPAVDFQ